MLIDILDDLYSRLKQLAKGTGQDVGTLVCEAIEQRLAHVEQKNRPHGALAWQSFSVQDPFAVLIGSCEAEGSPGNAQTGQ